MRPNSPARLATAVARLRCDLTAHEIASEINDVHPTIEWHLNERFLSDITSGKRSHFNVLSRNSDVVRFAFGLLRATFRVNACPIPLHVRLEDVDAILEEFLGKSFSSRVSEHLRFGLAQLAENTSRRDFINVIEQSLLEWLN